MIKNLSILREKLKGPIFSIITPFKKNEEIDYDALGKYIKKVYNSGGKIFFVMAYNSRFSELSWSEIKDLNEFVTKKVKGLNTNNIVIVADPLHCSTKKSIEFCKHAEDIGADIISLIFREKFYSNEQVYSHYKKCAETTQIGILIHEMPLVNGRGGEIMNWPVSLLDQIADIKNVIAIKEDAKEDNYSYKVINCLKNRLAIIISGGGKRQWLKFSEEGCQAWLNGIGVFEPNLPIIFYEAYKKNNRKIIDLILNNVEDVFFKEVVAKFGWHIGIKACLEARNIFPRFERMPLMAISDTEMNMVKKTMIKIEKSIEEIYNLEIKN
tara:strand:- start:10350 stop:11324 length:975 start_codon:yes stop_codon:yes gene_type:complete